MGYNISYAAIRGIDKNRILEGLSLTDSGEPDPENESELSGVMLLSSWYLVQADDLLWGAETEKFSKLSSQAEILVCLVSEVSFTFMCSSYRGGQLEWEITQTGDEDPMIEGDLPETVQALLNSLSNASDEHGDPATLPVEMFHSITGYKYDPRTPPLGFTKLVWD